MKNDKIRPKNGLQLRKIGDRYMIVDSVDGATNLCDVYSLNRTAARIWEHIGENASTFDELAGWLCDTYAVEKEILTRDLERLLVLWETEGLITLIPNG